jgi:hypothetical protein
MIDPLLQIRDRVAGEAAYYERTLVMALGKPGEVWAAEDHSAAVARLRAFDGLRRGQKAHLG